jgi:C-terminal processing protease CtpA/Prc
MFVSQGLIQSVYELSDSSGLIITVGKYLTPRGVDIDRFGIAPDFNSLPDPNAAQEALNACRLDAAVADAAAAGQQRQLQLAAVSDSSSGLA